MADEARKDSPFELAQAVWRRRKWLALIVFAAPFSAVVGLVTSLPNTYQASAKIVVERQQLPEAFVKSTVTSEFETRLHTISQEVLSRSRLEELINRFGLYAHLRHQVPQEALIERMRGDIRLEIGEPGARRAAPRGITFTVSFRGGDPNNVALVANTLASVYIEENLRVRERQATGTAEFLRVQLDETKKRLDEQERRVSEFKKRYVGELPEQMTANLATLERLHTQLRLNGDNQARAVERREAAARQLAETESFGSSGAPDVTATRLGRLRQDLTELRARFSDRYPEVIRVKTEIAALERQLTDAKPEERPPLDAAPPTNPHVLRMRQALNELEAEVKVLKNEERHLRTTMAAYQARVENAPRREQELQELSRDYQTTKELYATLLKRSEEAQLAESMEQRQKGEQFRVVEPALPSHEPAAPKRAQLVLMGLLLSLGLAGGAVLLAEQRDTSFHTVDEVRAFTSVPVLVSIPRINTEADARRRRWRGRVVVSAAIVGLTVIVGTSYLIGRGNEGLVSIISASRS